jgi:nucleoside-diphosphate-sugar epimerase
MIHSHHWWHQPDQQRGSFLRTLITGSTGFIGARLATRCLQNRQQVVALGQVNTPIEEFRRSQLRDLGIDTLPVPLNDTGELRKKLEGCDTVYHLAAAQHEANVPDRYFRDVNVEGTRNILDASIEAGIKRFVHGSTIGVYGAALNGEIDEETAPHPNNIYGVTKLEGEKLALHYSDRLPVSVIRISETYGPGDGRLLKLFKAIDKRRFFLIGKGQNLHQLIYVDDLVEALMAAAERREAIGKSIVVAGQERLTTADMCRTIADGIGVPLSKFRLPMWPFLTAAILMEKTLSPLGIQPPLHRRRLDFFRKSFFFSQKMASEILRFAPTTDFNAGVHATAKWYRENNLM